MLKLKKDYQKKDNIKIFNNVFPTYSNADNKFSFKKTYDALLQIKKLNLVLDPRVKKRLRINFPLTGKFTTLKKFETWRKYYYMQIRGKVYLRINANNTIISLTNLKGQVQYNLSAGKLGLSSSKRTYKFVHKTVIEQFFIYLKKNKLDNNLHFRIIAPKILRKKIIKQSILPKLKGKKFMIELMRLLPFNGCRPPKKRRKKKQGLRIFKT